MKDRCWFKPALMLAMILGAGGISAMSFAAHVGTQYTVYDVVYGSTLQAETRVVIVPIDSGKEQYSLAVQFQDSGESNELIFDVGICEAPSSDMATVTCGGGYDQRWSELGTIIEELQGYTLVEAKFSAIIEVPRYTAHEPHTLSGMAPFNLTQIDARQVVDMVRHLELSFVANQDQTSVQLIKAERRIPYIVQYL